MFRFIHAADVHLDSPLLGLERYESAPVEAVRGATRRAFERLVGLAIAEKVAFVLLAGDVYDGEWKDYRTGHFFVEQMVKLREAGIAVFLVAGNHDAESRITKALRLPDNVRAFSTERPETHVLAACDVAVHGQGYGVREVMTDLTAAYPAADPALFNIGLLHTSLDGRDGHAPYAPTSAAKLTRLGYDYWALGHVHTREVVAREPWIVFPGNVQGRHIREPGAKGCTLVTVEGGRVAAAEPRRLDVLRWARADVDLTGVDRVDDVFAAVANAVAAEGARDDGPLAIGIDLIGRPRCFDALAARPEHWAHEIRGVGAEARGDVWIERVRLKVTRAVGGGARTGLDGTLAALIAGAEDGLSPADLEAFGKALSEVRGALPAEADDALPVGDAAFLSEIGEEALELLLARLSGGKS